MPSSISSYSEWVNVIKEYSTKMYNFVTIFCTFIGKTRGYSKEAIYSSSVKDCYL